MMELHPRFHEVVAKLQEILPSPKLLVFGRADAWLKADAIPEVDIYPVVTRIAAQGRWNGSSLSYFDGGIMQSIADRTKPMPEAKPRVDSKSAFKREPTYTPPPEPSPDAAERHDRSRADLLNRGINVMSVTYQDAQRMRRNGWLSDEAAERFGLSKVAV
jgi:hypothetical protein